MQGFIRERPAPFVNQHPPQDVRNFRRPPRGDREDLPPSPVLLVSISDNRIPVSVDNIFQTFSQLGEVIKIVTFVRNNALQAFVQYRDINTAIRAKTDLHGKDMFIGCCPMNIQFAKVNNLQVRANDPRSRDYTQLPTSATEAYPKLPMTLGMGAASSWSHAPFLGQAIPRPIFMDAAHAGMGEEGCVLLVSNLKQEVVTPEILFNLFGVYGDVVRVKILYNKKDAAFIQFATAQQASVALTHLNHAELFGLPMAVRHSKYKEIILPRNAPETIDPEGVRLTRDFSNSPLHRFKFANSKNYKHIYPPSAVLHVSNIFDGCTEQELTDVFANHGEVVAVEFFKNDHKMALVMMKTKGDAINALVSLHNRKIGNRNIRVSFSGKAGPGQRPAIQQEQQTVYGTQEQ